ncbi:hypothetical protein [Dongia rigui]|uniref:Uncharacterized protein n=1 Tax=Dongia rigui TaxID=940149 RepID=A0ABU5E0U3_9PROT|nr:hypothetical protein [Dongia rigui]MDY0872523.1 hypothetical protein [Dongia rigui]
MGWHKGKFSIVAALVAVALLVSCAMPASRQQAGEHQSGVDVDLRSRLTAANLMAGSLAEGLSSAIRLHAVTPGSERALLIAATLDAVDRSLDGAGTALRAGLSDLATRQIGAAEMQLYGLQPLLPMQGQPKVTEDAP